MAAYDVFLSFRNEDTRFAFTSHLDEILRGAGISVFIDYRLEKGEEMLPSILKAIQSSRIAIIVFSENYASSRWCLDELLQIMECRRAQAQPVLPIFYNVHPFDVRDQKGRYGEAMVQHEQRFEINRVSQWRQALTIAANLLAFFDRAEFVNDADLIAEIVADVLDAFNH